MKNKKIIYLLSFIIPILLLMMYLFLYKIKFTDLFISDLKEQYTFLFDYYKSILNGKQSILYSFSNGLGGSMYGTFFYYLSSPLNLLLTFFSEEKLYIGIIMLIFIKIGLSGFTMNYYLNKSNNNSLTINLIFSICYALMSYNIMYYFNTMWLDIVYLTPLVILGLDEILENKKSKKYIIFLIISIISNWYISYMLCIFIVIYFIFRLINIKNNRKEIVKKFIISNILVGLICCFILIPIIFELPTKIGNNSEYNSSFTEKIIYFINNIGISLKDKNKTYYIFNIYCGIFPLILFINYVLFTKDKDKFKIIVVLIILIISLFIPKLIYIWHGFSYPTNFNYRWSFLFSFFLIITISEKYSLLKKINKNKQIKLSIIYLLILLISLFINKNTNLLLILINTFFFFSYIELFNLSKINKKYEITILLLVLIECFLFIKTNFITNISIKENNIEYSNYIEEKDYFLSKINNYNSDRMIGLVFSPLEKLNTNIGDINNFLTTRNDKYYYLLSKLGYFAITNESYSNVDNCLINNLLGINYIYNVDLNNNCYKKIDDFIINEKNIDIYKSNYNNSIGYLINKNNIVLNSDNVFLNLNKIGNLFVNKDIYDTIDNNNDYYFMNENDYIYIYSYISKKVKILIDNEIVYEKEYDENDLNSYGFIIIKNNYKNQRVKIETYINNKKIDNNYVSTFNEVNYNYLFDNIDSKLEDIKINKNVIEGNINVETNNKRIMLTIPYDKNWNIYIDGEKIEYDSIADLFICFDINKGNHNIKMVYFPKYLKFSIIISFIGILFSMCYFIKKN